VILVVSLFLILIVFVCFCVWRRFLNEKHARLCERYGFTECSDPENVRELITKLLSHKSLNIYLLYAKNGIFVGRCSTTLLGGAGSFEKKLSFFILPVVNLKSFVLCKSRWEEVLFDQRLLVRERDVDVLNIGILSKVNDLVGEKNNYILCGVDNFVAVLKPSWFFDGHELDLLCNVDLASQ